MTQCVYIHDIVIVISYNNVMGAYPVMCLMSLQLNFGEEEGEEGLGEGKGTHAVGGPCLGGRVFHHEPGNMASSSLFPPDVGTVEKQHSELETEFDFEQDVELKELKCEFIYTYICVYVHAYIYTCACICIQCM